jgi:hypothetical protein
MPTTKQNDMIPFQMLLLHSGNGRKPLGSSGLAAISADDGYRIPEPAYTEKETAQNVAAHLRKEGLPVQTGIATCGGVGLMDTGKPRRPGFNPTAL